MAGAPQRDPVRLVTAAMVGAREKVDQALGAAAVWAPVVARAEAARATNRGPARETRPVRLLTEGETVFIPGHGPGVPTEVRAGSRPRSRPWEPPSV